MKHSSIKTTFFALIVSLTPSCSHAQWFANLKAKALPYFQQARHYPKTTAAISLVSLACISSIAIKQYKECKLVEKQEAERLEKERLEQIQKKQEEEAFLLGLTQQEEILKKIQAQRLETQRLNALRQQKLEADKQEARKIEEQKKIEQRKKEKEDALKREEAIRRENEQKRIESAQRDQMLREADARAKELLRQQQEHESKQVAYQKQQEKEKLEAQKKEATQKLETNPEEKKSGEEWIHVKSLTPAFLEKIKKENPDYENQIKAFMALLDQIARRKNQAFEEGTYVVEDPQETLFTFLKDFNDGKGNYAYARSSSHFPERLPKVYLGLGTEGYGINIALPHAMNHILFNRFQLNGKNYIFIKPEPHGTSYDELLPHAWGYGGSLWRKWFQPKANEGAAMRKEHTPVQTKKLWANLVDHATAEDRLLKAAFKREGEEYGIYKMLQTIKENPRVFTDLKLNKEFIDALTTAGYDNLDVRKGREVIITTKDLNAAVNPAQGSPRIPLP